MTREDATNVLGDVRAYLASRASLENEILAGHTFTGICNAIKSLEQQPSEDCVSRQAVEKITWEEPSYSDALNVLTEVRDKVRALPPVTPTRKVGHWIDSEILGEFKCSYCGNYWQDAEENEYEDWVNIAKYCPNCGAEMESEE